MERRFHAGQGPTQSVAPRMYVCVHVVDMQAGHYTNKKEYIFCYDLSTFPSW